MSKPTMTGISMDQVPSSELRKAAILIDCLKVETTRILLRSLNRVLARDVYRLARDLRDVSKEEKEAVLTEFLQGVQELSPVDPSRNNPASRSTETLSP